MQPELNGAQMSAKPEEEPKLSPLQQWDRLCAEAILQTLAPKGFKTIALGNFKGLEIVKRNVETPGTLKDEVIRATKITAQCVRAFRDKARHTIIETRDKYVEQEKLAAANLKSLGLFNFLKRREVKDDIIALNAMIGTCNILLNELVNLEVKAPAK